MTALAAMAPVLGVWLAAAVATAACIGLLWGHVRPRIARWHPADRGRMLLALAAAPVLLPTALVVTVWLPGVLGLLEPGLDHCGLHPGHPHLCLVHPGAFLPVGLAATMVAICGGALLAVAHACRRAWLQARPLRALSSIATGKLAPGVDVVELDRPLALTHGLLWTKTLISSGLLRSLRPEQVEVVVAHEAAHARRRDPLRQLVARIASAPMRPSIRRELVAELELCAEQACDERAADLAGDRLAVAQTILDVERMRGEPGLDFGLAPAGAGAGIGDGSISRRVTTLLADPARRRPGRLRPWPALMAIFALVLASRPIHHEIEHLLAWALGAH